MIHHLQHCHTVASSRNTRLSSDSGAFADWVSNPNPNPNQNQNPSSSGLRASEQDLSLGFNAGPSAAVAVAHGGVWSSSSGRQLNYGVPAEMGMGMFVVAPSTHHVLTATPYLTAEDGGVRVKFSDYGFGSGSGGGSGSAAGSTTCQDCGNQAKKDCNHRRCRTCCKSRGFDCATHVKSTWVPAARRRERQLIGGGTAGGGGGGGAGSSTSTSGTKKPRLDSRTTTPSHTSTSNTTSSYHQDANFMQTLPSQVRAPAVFRCVRVTAVDDGDDEYAYQACVTISGHVFKGFLYDHGVETRNQTNILNLSELHLGGGGGGGGRNAGCSLTSPPLDPPGVYGSSTGGLLG